MAENRTLPAGAFSHWYCSVGAPVAITLKVPVAGAVTVRLDGWLLMTGGDDRGPAAIVTFTVRLTSGVKTQLALPLAQPLTPQLVTVLELPLEVKLKVNG